MRFFKAINDFVKRMGSGGRHAKYVKDFPKLTRVSCVGGMEHVALHQRGKHFSCPNSLTVLSFFNRKINATVTFLFKMR